jgi:rhodanese-related sulfurtransferase
MYTGMILDNAINQGRPLITAQALEQLIQSDEKYMLIDARVAAQYEKAHIDTAQNMPHGKLRELASDMDKNVVAITYCNKGVTGNAAQNILINQGFKKVYNLSGGHKHFTKESKNNE